MRTKHGFTVVELMVVIGIIAILSTIAIPNYLGWRTKQQLSKAVNDVQAAIQMAKMAAIKQNTEAVITFDPSTDSYVAFLDSDEDGNRDAGEPLIRSASFASRGIQLSTTFTSNALVIDGRGFTDTSGKGVTLQRPGEGEWNVDVTVTGCTRVARVQ